MRTCREISNLVKNRRINYRIIYTMDVNMLYCCRRSYIAIRAISSREMASGCKDSRGGINIMRTRHYVTLYTHCLSFIVFPNYKISCFFYTEDGNSIGNNLAINVVCHSPEQNVEQIPNFPSTYSDTSANEDNSFRNHIRQPKRDFPQVSTENRSIRSGCCPLFKDKFYKIVKSTL